MLSEVNALTAGVLSPQGLNKSPAKRPLWIRSHGFRNTMQCLQSLNLFSEGFSEDFCDLENTNLMQVVVSCCLGGVASYSVRLMLLSWSSPVSMVEIGTQHASLSRLQTPFLRAGRGRRRWLTSGSSHQVRAWRQRTGLLLEELERCFAAIFNDLSYAILPRLACHLHACQSNKNRLGLGLVREALHAMLA